LLEAATKGELTDKKNMQMQEYNLKRWHTEGLAPLSEGFLDKNWLKQRMHMYKMGDHKMPYEVPSFEEGLCVSPPRPRRRSRTTCGWRASWRSAPRRASA